MAVHRVALRDALHDRKRLALVGFREPVEVLHDAERLRECLRIVEHDLLLETDDPAPIGARRVDLDRLELVAELEPAMGDPALNVRRPRDQRVAVPEADRLAEPLGNVWSKARYHALLVELAADVDLRDEGL